MMDRAEILVARMRRLVSRNRWSARLLGYAPEPGHANEAGLLLIQIDGLGHQVLESALREGRMPFLRHLLHDEDHELQRLYAGVPSSTPGFQAELYYGRRNAVPAFGYRDSTLDRVVSMNDPSAAAAVEERLRHHAVGLLQGGSCWCTIFHGGADESHLCASTAGLDMLWKALNPLRTIGLIVWYGWSLVRILGFLVVETGLALYDLLRGTLEGKNFAAELRFVPLRVAVSAVMREIVTAGASVDCERGLPIIQVNYLGYDEHAHRRGPNSRFARWTLKGIDHSIRRVWLAAHRSKMRDYQVWIYSDHGQEETIPYPKLRLEDLSTAVQRIVQRFEMLEAPIYRAQRERALAYATATHRSQWLRRELPRWLAPGDPRRKGDPLGATSREPRLEVVHQGPVGFVYPARHMDREEMERLAQLIARDAAVPMVMVAFKDGARVFRDGQKVLELPEDAAEVFGAEHPYLREVTADTIAMLHHPDAGPLALFGYRAGSALSLQLENGAHGGPGPEEVSAFAILPREATVGQPIEGTLRPSHLREMALRALGGVMLPQTRDGLRPSPAISHANEQECPRVHLRLVSYNVHGCRGMDGKYSPQRIARVLSRLQPDIICLQELDHDRGRSGGTHQVAQLAESLAADFHFHSVSEFHDGRFGNAILSHHPLRLVDHGPLPALKGFPGLEERGILWVEVDLEGITLQVLNTHLSILERERRIQVEAILKPRWLGENLKGVPVILCGDLNAGPDSWTSRRLGEVLRNVSEGVDRQDTARTWSGRLPLRRIDHVFVGGPLRADRVMVPRTRLTRVASDHMPLVTDLSLPVRATELNPRPCEEA